MASGIPIVLKSRFRRILPNTPTAGLMDSDGFQPHIKDCFSIGSMTLFEMMQRFLLDSHTAQPPIFEVGSKNFQTQENLYNTMRKYRIIGVEGYIPPSFYDSLQELGIGVKDILRLKIDITNLQKNKYPKTQENCEDIPVTKLELQDDNDLIDFSDLRPIQLLRNRSSCLSSTNDKFEENDHKQVEAQSGSSNCSTVVKKEPPDDSEAELIRKAFTLRKVETRDCSESKEKEKKSVVHEKPRCGETIGMPKDQSESVQRKREETYIEVKVEADPTDNEFKDAIGNTSSSEHTQANENNTVVHRDELKHDYTSKDKDKLSENLSKCYLCAEKIEEDKMWDHVQEVHMTLATTGSKQKRKKSWNFFCTHCLDNSFRHINEVKAHENLVHVTGVSCYFCGLSMKTFNQGLRHIARCHAKSFKCECNEIFAEEGDYLMHAAMAKHTLSRTETVVSYTCLFCSQKFSDELSCILHIKHLVCSDCQLFGFIRTEQRCPSCDSSFFDREALRFHQCKRANLPQFAPDRSYPALKQYLSTAIRKDGVKLTKTNDTMLEATKCVCVKEVEFQYNPRLFENIVAALPQSLAEMVIDEALKEISKKAPEILSDFYQTGLKLKQIVELCLKLPKFQKLMVSGSSIPTNQYVKAEQTTEQKIADIVREVYSLVKNMNTEKKSTFEDDSNLNPCFLKILNSSWLIPTDLDGEPILVKSSNYTQPAIKSQNVIPAIKPAGNTIIINNQQGGNNSIVLGGPVNQIFIPNQLGAVNMLNSLPFQSGGLNPGLSIVKTTIQNSLAGSWNTVTSPSVAMNQNLLLPQGLVVIGNQPGGSVSVTAASYVLPSASSQTAKQGQTVLTSVDTAQVGNLLTQNVALPGPFLPVNQNSIVVQNTQLPSNLVSEAVMVQNTQLPSNLVSEARMVQNSQLPSNLVSGAVMVQNAQLPLNLLSGAGMVQNPQLPSNLVSGAGMVQNTQLPSNLVSGAGMVQNTQLPSNLVSGAGMVQNAQLPLNLLSGARMVQNTQLPSNLVSGAGMVQNTQLPSNLVSGAGMVQNAQLPLNLLSGARMVQNTQLPSNLVSGAGMVQNAQLPLNLPSGGGMVQNAQLPSNLVSGAGMVQNVQMPSIPSSGTVMVQNSQQSSNLVSGVETSQTIVTTEAEVVTTQAVEAKKYVSPFIYNLQNLCKSITAESNDQNRLTQAKAVSLSCPTNIPVTVLSPIPLSSPTMSSQRSVVRAICPKITPVSITSPTTVITSRSTAVSCSSSQGNAAAPSLTSVLSAEKSGTIVDAARSGILTPAQIRPCGKVKDTVSPQPRGTPKPLMRIPIFFFPSDGNEGNFPKTTVEAAHPETSKLLFSRTNTGKYVLVAAEAEGLLSNTDLKHNTSDEKSERVISKMVKKMKKEKYRNRQTGAKLQKLADEDFVALGMCDEAFRMQLRRQKSKPVYIEDEDFEILPDYSSDEFENADEDTTSKSCSISHSIYKTDEDGEPDTSRSELDSGGDSDATIDIEINPAKLTTEEVTENIGGYTDNANDSEENNVIGNEMVKELLQQVLRKRNCEIEKVDDDLKNTKANGTTAINNAIETVDNSGKVGLSYVKTYTDGGGTWSLISSEKLAKLSELEQLEEQAEVVSECKESNADDEKNAYNNVIPVSTCNETTVQRNKNHEAENDSSEVCDISCGVKLRDNVIFCEKAKLSNTEVTTDSEHGIQKESFDNKLRCLFKLKKCYVKLRKDKMADKLVKQWQGYKKTSAQGKTKIKTITNSAAKNTCWAIPKENLDNAKYVNDEENCGVVNDLYLVTEQNPSNNTAQEFMAVNQTLVNENSSTCKIVQVKAVVSGKNASDTCALAAEDNTSKTTEPVRKKMPILTHKTTIHSIKRKRGRPRKHFPTAVLNQTSVRKNSGQDDTEKNSGEKAMDTLIDESISSGTTEPVSEKMLIPRLKSTFSARKKKRGKKKRNLHMQIPNQTSSSGMSSQKKDAEKSLVSGENASATESMSKKRLIPRLNIPFRTIRNKECKQQITIPIQTSVAENIRMEKMPIPRLNIPFHTIRNKKCKRQITIPIQTSVTENIRIEKMPIPRLNTTSECPEKKHGRKRKTLPEIPTKEELDTSIEDERSTLKALERWRSVGEEGSGSGLIKKHKLHEEQFIEKAEEHPADSYSRSLTFLTQTDSYTFKKSQKKLEKWRSVGEEGSRSVLVEKQKLPVEQFIETSVEHPADSYPRSLTFSTHSSDTTRIPIQTKVQTDPFSIKKSQKSPLYEEIVLKKEIVQPTEIETAMSSPSIGQTCVTQCPPPTQPLPIKMENYAPPENACHLSACEQQRSLMQSWRCLPLETRQHKTENSNPVESVKENPKQKSDRGRQKRKETDAQQNQSRLILPSGPVPVSRQTQPALTVPAFPQQPVQPMPIQMPVYLQQPQIQMNMGQSNVASYILVPVAQSNPAQPGLGMAQANPAQTGMVIAQSNPAPPAMVMAQSNLTKAKMMMAQTNPAQSGVVMVQSNPSQSGAMMVQSNQAQQGMMWNQSNAARPKMVMAQSNSIQSGVMMLQSNPAQSGVVMVQSNPAQQEMMLAQSNTAQSRIVMTKSNPIQPKVVMAQSNPALQGVMMARSNPTQSGVTIVQSNLAQPGMMMVQSNPVQQGVMMAQSNPVRQGVMMAQSNPAQSGVMMAQSNPAQSGVMMAQSNPVQSGVMMAQSNPSQSGVMTVQSNPAQSGVMMAQSNPAQSGVMMAQSNPAQSGVMMAQSNPAQSGVMTVQSNPALSGVMMAQSNPAQSGVITVQSNPAQSGDAEQLGF